MEQLYSIFAGIVGGLVGSFLNVVILRLPDEKQSIVFPGSQCPQCKHAIAWYDNIPLLSYLMLRGRCRNCKTRISWQYPLVEACMALLSWGLFWQVGLSIAFLFYFLFLASLLVIIFIDIHHQIIPDRISLPGILVGLAGSFFVESITWQESIFGMLCGGGVLYGIAYGYYLLTGKEGMGGGDIKLLAMIGAFLGWQSLLYVVFSSSLLGSIIGVTILAIQRKGRQTRIPFGPFLAFGAISYLFFQEQIGQAWQWYMSLL